VVGRIMKATAVPVGMSWMLTLMFGHHEDGTPTHEAAMAAFASELAAGMIKCHLDGKLVDLARDLCQAGDRS
jgi:hypothetical protein